MTAEIKKNYLPFLIILLIFTSCRHNDSEDIIDNVLPSDVTVKSQTITWSFQDHHDTTISVVSSEELDFSYDNTGRLTRAGKIGFQYDESGNLISTTDGNNTVYYYWSDKRLSAISTVNGYYDGGSFTDTTTFEYSGNELIAALSTHENTSTEFIYNNNLIAAKYITHTEAGKKYCDSLLYKWMDGNLVSLQTCSSYPWDSYLYVREFKYDNHPSWIKAIKYPDAYLLVREITQFYTNYPLFYYEIIPWRYNNLNNPVEFTERTNDQVKSTPFHLHYNSSGYPVEIHGDNFEIDIKYN